MSKGSLSMLKGVLKDLKPFMEKQDTFRNKSIDVSKKIKKRLDENKDLKASDFNEELTSLEKFYFFDSLLGQNTMKLATQASILYQVCLLEKIELDLNEEEVKLLEGLVKDDFNLFSYEKGEIKLSNNDYTNSIIKSIESRDSKVREVNFQNMIKNPEFQNLEV